jgi:hypothetical protein
MMNAESNQAWWLAAIMYGGGGMFSSPLTVTRNNFGTSQRTSPRMMR